MKKKQMVWADLHYTTIILLFWTIPILHLLKSWVNKMWADDWKKTKATKESFNDKSLTEEFELTIVEPGGGGGSLLQIY